MPQGLRGRRWLIAAAIVAVAAALRLPGFANELWLDEVWSLTNALAVHSWHEVFTAIRIDNNHHLNSLWLYAVGDRGSASIDRLPAIVCGVGTVAAAFALAARDGVRTAAVTAALFALSFLMIYYSSEARGYASVVFFALAGWYCLREYIDRNARHLLAGFWVCCVLGILAHPTFIAFFVAALVWCDTHLQRVTTSVRTASRRTVLAFAPAALCLVVFYIVSIRGAVVMGGPAAPPAVVLAQMLSVLGSGPMQGPWMWIDAAIVGVLFVASLMFMARRDDDRWLLYAVGGIAMPALLVAVQRAAIYPRYFIVPGAFMLLAIGDLLSRAMRRGGMAHWASLAVLAGLSVGTAVNIDALYILGRGRFDRAVSRLVEGRSGHVTVATFADYTMFDFRSAMLIRYYGRVLKVGDRVRYVTATAYPPSGTDWMIRESLDASAPVARLVDSSGHLFVLDSAYRPVPLAGVAWLLYRRAEPRQNDRVIP